MLNERAAKLVSEANPTEGFLGGVGIMGTPVSSGNRGVLALGASLVNLCTEASGGGRVMLLLGNRDDRPARFRVGGRETLVPVVHARMSPRTHPRHHFLWILAMSVLYRVIAIGAVRSWIRRSTPWVDAVASAALVGDVRGGDSFSDIYGMRRFMMGFLMAWSVVLVRGSIVQFPQTYGPYRHWAARWLARFLLRRSGMIVARDKESQKVAQDLVGAAREVLLSPDVAFSLESVVPVGIELEPPRAGNSELADGGSSVPVVGLNVNGLMFHGGYTKDNMFGLKLDYRTFLRELLMALLAEQSGEVWLVPHTFAPDGDVESDPAASCELRASLHPELQRRVRVVVGDYDAHEIKGVIGQCDFFIGSRMHSCIAALSQGVPCVGVAYSMKFAGVFESVGMRDWVVDGRVEANREAVARVMELYRRRAGVREGLRAEARLARQRLTEVFQTLVGKNVSGRRNQSASAAERSLSTVCP